MRDIVKAFRRPPAVRLPDRNGGFPRLSDGVTHGFRCPASPRHALLAESLGKPSLWVFISEIWYKAANLRIFADAAGKMNRSLRDVGGGALVVSQFTLCAETRRGNRPGFSDAAAPEVAEALCARFCAGLADLGLAVSSGRFGAHMAVRLVNDGPVTIWLDTRAG